MPMYDFKCNECGEVTTKLQSFSKPNPECPKCGHSTSKMIGAPASHLKGNGWTGQNLTR